MGRTTEDKVDFYSHYPGGRMVSSLRKKFGNDGYAVYWLILDEIAGCEGHFLDLSKDNDLEDFALECMVSDELFLKIVDWICSRGRFDSEAWARKGIWCQKFVDKLEAVYKKRKRPAPICPGKSITVTEKPLPSQELPLLVQESHKEKERKGKERKEKHIWREQGENESKEPPTDIQSDFFALCDTYNAPDEKTDLNPAIQTYSRTVTALRRGKGWTYQEAVEALKTSAKAYHKWKSEMDERPHNLGSWLLSGEYAKNYAVKPMPGKTGKESNNPNNGSW